ncbi:MAG: SWIM zinc finger family protein [Anaerolineae bacterium]|nr:SWIM zinc finger family protein [Anaerolineae bacterium]MCA9910347.1 SWIM zinc finger family protein [Anaerolineae bacterium]
MDYGMIGKIEKAKRYAEQPQRITFHHFVAEFKGDNSLYTIQFTPEGWDCTCPGFRAHGICPHVMSLEKLMRPMLKRAPLAYAPGQNVVSDVEKAKRYAEEPDRIQFTSFDVSFAGDNGEHKTNYHAQEGWDCECDFYKSRHVCCHTMAMERLLKNMIASKSAIAGG